LPCLQEEILGHGRSTKCVSLCSPLYRTDHLHQHIQRNHPESHLSPKLEGTPLPNDILDPTATAVYTNQNMDEPTVTNVSQALETGPIVLQLSYSVGYCIPRLSSILGTNGRSFSCLKVRLG
jgi:hypothetical protein